MSEFDLICVRPKDVPVVTGGAMSERMARRLIAQRRIPFIKPGGPRGPVMIRLSDLEAYLDARTVPVED